LENTTAKQEISLGARSRGYMIYLVILMTIVALVDWYISMVKATALPYILKEYSLTPAQFSYTESLFMIPTFLIFLLNGLNDIIGRKWSVFLLVLLMGLSGICIVFFTPSYLAFMAFYAVAMFSTVSNMWSIPVSEESSAANRGKLVGIVYTIGLLPLAAIIPPIVVGKLGLSWKWVYGINFFIMLVWIVMWFFMKETNRYRQIQAERKAGHLKAHPFGIGSINKTDIKYIAICSFMWLCVLVDMFLLLWLGNYFMTLKGYTLQQWSFVLLLVLLAQLVGGVVGSWALDKIGRKLTWVIGCLGTAVFIAPIGFLSGLPLQIMVIIFGFFISFAYTWIVVYIPEVFPTERRGACLGWTTAVTRVSYVIGPMIAAVLLSFSPSMDWYWVITGVIMIIPAVAIIFIKPYETQKKTLEEIESHT